MWHEMSHVYVLSMTDTAFRAGSPKGWRCTRKPPITPDWGDRLDHPSIMAIKEKKLLPVAELDRGFIHPTYPRSGDRQLLFRAAGRHHLHRARSGAMTRCST